MLTLCTANGLKVPFLGYLELEVDRVKEPRCRVTVFKDTPATANKRVEVPGLSIILLRSPR